MPPEIHNVMIRMPTQLHSVVESVRREVSNGYPSFQRLVSINGVVRRVESHFVHIIRYLQASHHTTHIAVTRHVKIYMYVMPSFPQVERSIRLFSNHVYHCCNSFKQSFCAVQPFQSCWRHREVDWILASATSMMRMSCLS